MQTEWRALNFSRGISSKYGNTFHHVNYAASKYNDKYSQHKLKVSLLTIYR